MTHTLSRPPHFLSRGKISPYAQPKNAPAIRHLFPHYTRETISGAGHWVHVDAPKRFAELVETFAER
ncbi:hypothetical protein AA14337_1593 [Acetobacter malorum DSM 14337]|uniref:Uncharacterized protein n=1 Tax=Acetobacter malorum DSM 14337 TaxID=1307910 RepID=A0ABQ0PSR8_9PROT|nr:hypothetical protein AA14337_1593 [Acetobacter malorum DSM 14337]